jgi:hypothetical protein
MFFAQLSDKSYIYVPADRMKEEDNMIYVYDGDQLVAMADVSVILHAHFGVSMEVGQKQ